MDEDYVNRKIENCEKLIEAATSEDQKKIYQGYLDYWSTKEHMEIDLKNAERIVTMSDKEFRKQTEIIEAVPEVAYANMFEIEHAPKKAYYSRGGETHKTKAFKEYLNQRTQ